MQNLPALSQNYKVPVLDDLYSEKEGEIVLSDKETAAKLNELNKALNFPPSSKWLRDHPIAKKEITVNGVKQKIPIQYIPIAVIEYLLTRFFIQWMVDVKSVEIMANSVVVTVRLHYLNPVTMDWSWSDGVGAAPIRTEKGASATDFTKIQDSAVQTAAPAAKSYAIKDAAECIGKIFGKDLNRNDEMNYQPMQEARFKDMPAKDLPEELIAVIEEKETPEELAALYNSNQEYHSNPDFMKKIMARTEAIRAGKGGQNG